jgi:ATP-dependent DNA helicase RecQ
MLDQLKDVIARTWGFRELRPLQEPAMRAVLDGRDSLVVLPTGGGKSLCYQAPAVVRGDTTVEVWTLCINTPTIAPSLFGMSFGGMR